MATAPRSITVAAHDGSHDHVFQWVGPASEPHPAPPADCACTRTSCRTTWQTHQDARRAAGEIA